jgi:exosome complex component RRP42
MITMNQHIAGLASKAQRADKRNPDEYRKIEIENNPLEKPEGCAQVKLGDTIVLAGVKMDIGTPFSDRPDEGVLMVNAEFSPIASPDFEYGPPSDDSVELARVVDRGIRESHSIDLKKLCIEKGEKVWMVNVDIHIMNHGGNLIDASGMAAIAALHNTRMPELKDGQVNWDKKTSQKLPMEAKPIPVSFVKIEGNLFMDPSLEEEGNLGARLTVTTKDDGNIVAIQKGGSEAFTLDEIKQAFQLASKKAKDIRKLIK